MVKRLFLMMLFCINAQLIGMHDNTAQQCKRRFDAAGNSDQQREKKRFICLMQAFLYGSPEEQAAATDRRQKALEEGRCYFVDGEWLSAEDAAVHRQSGLENMVRTLAAYFERGAATAAHHQAVCEKAAKANFATRLAAAASRVVDYFDRQVETESAACKAAWKKGWFYNFNGQWMSEDVYNRSCEAWVRVLLQD